MKKPMLRYIVVALFLIAALLFTGFLMYDGMELSLEPVLGFFAFVLFLALFLGAAHGASKLWAKIRTKKDE